MARLGQTTILEDLPAAIEALLNDFAAWARERIGAPAEALRPKGKHLRTRFTLLLGRALQAPVKTCERISAIAELLHQASLLQDDCVDDAKIRRGEPTAGAAFGDKAAILLGDLSMTKAFELAQPLPPPAREGLVDCVRNMALGELEEYLHRGSLDVSAVEYERVAMQKTGELFAWCAVAVGLAAGRAADDPKLKKLGLLTGLAFQIVDDVLDYDLGGVNSSKESLQDLRTRQVNHPLLEALASPRHGAEIRSLAKAVFDRYDTREARQLAERIAGYGFLNRSRDEASRVTRVAGGLLEGPLDTAQAGEFRKFLQALALRGA